MDYIIKKTDQEISTRKLEGYRRWANVVQWGRRNPVQFAEQFIGIEFMDYQRYTFASSWSKMFCIWLYTRNGGKSFQSAPFIMAKSLLFNNFQSYILSNNSAQSQETFMKMEKIAKKQIESIVGLTDIFLGELVRSGGSDGFTHAPSGFKYNLYNGSGCTSLCGEEDNIRGFRSNLNLYDESGWLSENYAVTTTGFCLQNSDFKMGRDLNEQAIAKNIPNQVIFCSSASDVDSYFYGIYKDWSKQMFLGSDKHFVVDLNCDAVLVATNKGEKLKTPLIKKETIDNAMRQNREKAMREYYNKFSRDGGEDALVKRSAILKNSYLRKPMLGNEGNINRRFIMAYDPARQNDLAIITIAEVIEDADVGLKLRISSCISLVDIGTKKKIPMRTPEQIRYLKELIRDYNGTGFAHYENIEAVLIDAGAGGGGVTIADSLIEDYVDDKGKLIPGLIDPVFSEEYVHRFPNAVKKLGLIPPKKYRNEMFESLREMINQGLIEFTESYDLKGYITMPFEDKDGNIEYKQINLTFEEELSLKNIDLAKEELVMMQKIKTSPGVYKYDLPKDKKNNTHDDRAYTFAMLAWKLKELRRAAIANKRPEGTNWEKQKIYVNKIKLR